MSLLLWNEALGELHRSSTVSDPPLRWRRDDGSSDLVALDSWSGPPSYCDRLLLQRLRETPGRVLDVGCGPGRLAAAAQAAGLPSLGIDVAPAAIRIARSRGATAAVASVFGDLPETGPWRHILLIDGNVGIGGCPTTLLGRCRDLLETGGLVHAEIAPPGTRQRRGLVRLEHPAGRVGDWFPWAEVSVNGLTTFAHDAGLAVRKIWTCGRRWFAELTHVEHRCFAHPSPRSLAIANSSMPASNSTEGTKPSASRARMLEAVT
jgi:SAM-dependent methyltransferase